MNQVQLLPHFYLSEAFLQLITVTQNQLSELFFFLRVTTHQNSHLCKTATCEQKVRASSAVKNRWEVTQVSFFLIIYDFETLDAASFY